MDTPDWLMRAYERSTNTHRFNEVEPLIAADAVYWFTEGAFEGHAAIREAFERTWAAIQEERYTISDLRWIVQEADLAICLYTFRWQGIIQGQLREGQGRGTNIFQRRDGQWVVVHEHLSALPSSSA